MADVAAKNAEIGSVYKTNRGRVVTVIAKNYLKRVLVHVHASGTEVPLPGDYVLTPSDVASPVDVKGLQKHYGKSPKKVEEVPSPTVPIPAGEVQDETGTKRKPAKRARAKIAENDGASQTQVEPVTDTASLRNQVLNLLRSGCTTHAEVYHSLQKKFPNETRSVLFSRATLALSALSKLGQVTFSKETDTYEALPESD